MRFVVIECPLRWLFNEKLCQLLKNRKFLVEAKPSVSGVSLRCEVFFRGNQVPHPQKEKTQ